MIGGNIEASIQERRIEENAIGEGIEKWHDIGKLWGYLDYSAGTAEISRYRASIEQSTHIFYADYTPIELTEGTHRLVVAGRAYDVLLFDDPMGLHDHFEIYLKYEGRG